MHAWLGDGTQVAHYAQANKWYLERPDGTHENVKLGEAVAEVAQRIHDNEPDARWFEYRAGGISFDAKMRKSLAALRRG